MTAEPLKENPMEGVTAPPRMCGKTVLASTWSTECRGAHVCTRPPTDGHAIHECKCGHTWTPPASYHRNHPYQ